MKPFIDSDYRHDNSVLAVIPARGNSKGLPGKNKMTLCGQAMFTYSVESALAASNVTDVMLSSEDIEILNIAKEYHGLMIRHRPKKLSEDQVQCRDVVNDCLLYYRETIGPIPAYILLLQPTSPFLTHIQIESCLQAFITSKCLSVVSVVKTAIHPSQYFSLKNGELEPWLSSNSIGRQRQEMDDVYQPNGAIYGIKAKHFNKANDFVSSPTLPFIMDESDGIDVDKQWDFDLAEMIMQKRRYKKCVDV